MNEELVGESVTDITRFCPKSTILGGFAVRSRDVIKLRMRSPIGCVKAELQK